MHEVVFQIAALWLAILVVPCAILVIRASSVTTRILALDTLVLVLIGLLVLLSDSEGVSFFLDAALLLALLGFVSTLAAARFHAQGKIF
jgi:multicomponent Na+:H+ antiporter subunit F